MLQTKKQGKNTQKQINEDEVGNLPEKEFSNDSKNDSRGFPGDSLATCETMQETQACSLVQEDPTCHETNKTMCHNYRAYALEPRI